jgi:type IV pilus assembly protein PilB
MLQEFTDTAIDFTETTDEDAQVDENAAPIVRLVHLLITEAVQMRATHVYIRPQADGIRIVYVIDGSPHERDCPPRRLLMAIIRRLQILANIDLNLSRSQLQSGEMQISVGNTYWRIRVYIVPTADGPSAILRLKDQPCQVNDIDRLAESSAFWLNAAQKACGDDPQLRETYQRLIEDSRA